VARVLRLTSRAEASGAPGSSRQRRGWNAGSVATANGACARGPPLWEDCNAQTDEVVLQIEPDWATDWDGAAQPAPDYEVDQRVSW
jgi:hypothetical protein